MTGVFRRGKARVLLSGGSNGGQQHEVDLEQDGLPPLVLARGVETIAVGPGGETRTQFIDHYRRGDLDQDTGLWHYKYEDNSRNDR